MVDVIFKFCIDKEKENETLLFYISNGVIKIRNRDVNGNARGMN